MLGKLNAKTQGRKEGKKTEKPFLLGIPGAPASPPLCVNFFSPLRCPSTRVAPVLALPQYSRCPSTRVAPALALPQPSRCQQPWVLQIKLEAIEFSDFRS